MADFYEMDFMKGIVILRYIMLYYVILSYMLYYVILVVKVDEMYKIR